MVCESGIDTARVLYRVHDERDHQRLCEVSQGRPVLSGEFGGLRAGWMPEHELLWLEGRPAKALGLGAGLLPPEALPDALHASMSDVSDMGLLTSRPREVGCSRIDATATVELDRPDEGWALLRGMAALEMPRRKAALYVDRGRPQTVYRLTVSGKVRERIYDKGAQLGSGEPGRRIRFEAQTRWPAGSRDTTEHWHAERVAEEFERRFRPMAAAADGLRVASAGVIAQQLRELVDRGSITGRQAELLAGHITCEAVGIERKRSSVYRRRADLRRLGFAQALDGAGDDVEVQVADVLGELLEARWNG